MFNALAKSAKAASEKVGSGETSDESALLTIDQLIDDAFEDE